MHTPIESALVPPLAAPHAEFNYAELSEAQAIFRRWGFCGIIDFVDEDLAGVLAARAIAAAREGRLPRSEGDNGGVPVFGTDGKSYASYIADTDLTSQVLPELVGLYRAARLLTENVIRKAVVLSPYPSSAVTTKVYAPGDHQNWHRDTNPITALLVLAGPPPVLERIQIPAVTPGTLLIFAGREHVHYVPPSDDWKVTVPFNLYHPWDTWRPEGMDGYVCKDA